MRAYTDNYKTIYNYFTQHPESIDKFYTELDLDSLDYGGKSNLLNWYKIEYKIYKKYKKYKNIFVFDSWFVDTAPYETLMSECCGF